MLAAEFLSIHRKIYCFVGLLALVCLASACLGGCVFLNVNHVIAVFIEGAKDKKRKNQLLLETYALRFSIAVAEN